MSKTQIDRLGDRLKEANTTEADLRLLDSYRLSFTDAYEIVVGAIRETLLLEPTGRPAKSTTSISDKLRRESIRLTQIQDIAGCRLTVSDIAMQDFIVGRLRSLFGHPAVVMDRRQQPSHGYRAVHVIMNIYGKLIEIQVRTELQHLWAELSEKLSDVVDRAIKYGGGHETIRSHLATLSSGVEGEEQMESMLAELLLELSSMDRIPLEASEKIERNRQVANSARQSMQETLRITIEGVESLRGNKDALSD